MKQIQRYRFDGDCIEQHEDGELVHWHDVEPILRKVQGKRLKVYIASPYTLGDVALNVRASMRVWDRLFSIGFAPMAPLWSHFQHLMFPRPYEDWMTADDEWIVACDAMLRLPGESKGADREVARAKKLGIPVFYTEDDLLAWRDQQTT